MDTEAITTQRPAAYTPGTAWLYQDSRRASEGQARLLGQARPLPQGESPPTSVSAASGTSVPSWCERGRCAACHGGLCDAVPTHRGDSLPVRRHGLGDGPLVRRAGCMLLSFFFFFQNKNILHVGSFKTLKNIKPTNTSCDSFSYPPETATLSTSELCCLSIRRRGALTDFLVTLSGHSSNEAALCFKHLSLILLW